MRDHAPLDRRAFLSSLAGLAGLGALAAGCAGPGTVRGGGGGGVTGTAMPPIGTGRVRAELSFAHWRAEDKTVFDELIAGFTGENPGTTVVQDIAPSNDYQSTALQRIRGGEVGDVFTSFPGAQFAQLSDAGVYTDLSAQLFTDRFEPRYSRPGKSANGDQLGLPYQLVFNTPVYSVDAFERAGVTEPPTDWDGYLALCEKLLGAGMVPLAWPGGEPGNAGHLFNCMVMNNAPTDDMCAGIEQGRYRCTDDWFLRTLGQYRELRPYFQPNATGTQVEPCQQLFAEGRAAMLATGSFHITAVRKLGMRAPLELLAPITVPRERARHVGAANATFFLGVNADSDSRRAAARFVEFLSRPEIAARYANATTQHVTVAGVDYTDRDLRATEHWLAEPTIFAPRYQFQDLDLRNAVENACVQVVSGTGPEQAAEQAQQIVEQRRGG